MASPLFGFNQPPAMLQSLLGNNYDPKQAQMSALLGAIGGFGRGLLSAKAGPYLSDAGVLASAGEGMSDGYQQAQDNYLAQAKGAYDMQMQAEDRQRKEMEWQAEQDAKAQEQAQAQQYQDQIDADPSLSPAQRAFLKANPGQGSQYYGRQLFPDPQQNNQPNVFGTVYFDQNRQPYVLDNQGNMRRPAGLPDDAQIMDPYASSYAKTSGAEAAKVNVQNQASAPGQLDDIQMARGLIQRIKQDPYKGRGTGFTSVGNMVPGTGGYDFQNLVNQAKSGAFLTAIQKMKGLGALSDREGQAAMSAITRLDTATSEEAFNQALDDYEQILNIAEQRVMQRTGIQQPADTGGGTKTYTFNPATGELE